MARRDVDAYVVAVENSAPYPVTVLHVNQHDLFEGDRMCDRWLATLEECERANSWPAYANGVLPFSIEEEEMDARVKRMFQP